jgi:hypothetical protein
VKLFYAFMGTLVCTVTALAASGAIFLTAAHNKNLRRLEERVLLAPGEAAARWLEGARVQKAASEGLDKLSDTKLAEEIRQLRVEERLGALAHYYNVGVWSGAGFLLCLILGAILGISSLMDAIALGFKVMCAVALLQTAFLLYCATAGCKLL